MEEKAINHIKLRASLALNKLLLQSKLFKDLDFDDTTKFAKSYGKISANADLRKATVSDNFNAKSDVRFSTLTSIVEGMGFTLSEFAKIYDSIKKTEMDQFAEALNNKSK
ncbi:hypothetical protein [Zunongwangia profunda]|uniref:Uncharacterized protein n=1 Tax=Zunongwangia profunda (strain DSM 18752 / CCTCC AB 206139 / SM-A87) TaxID=655815 RepID=D5B9T2_ZUNPS|nr:hypothetical protein [Zunongwangia profunda]ADF54395.1 hypothetical protein ZPR_4091 [Zunongwangia profunda SM-A87]MAG88371.1 hypothetical protein [Flavobacteriaceae bacterium]|tara:strand:+ start:299 stop:628 length:330 start_codon:yes stop_codon:yes gene_type:complete